MNSFKTIDFNIHFVNTLLKNKGLGSLSVVESLINEFKGKRQSWEQSIEEIKIKQDKLLLNKAQSEEPFKRLLQDKEIKMLQSEKETQNKLFQLQENFDKMKTQLHMSKNEEAQKSIEFQVINLNEQIAKAKENLLLIKVRHKETTEALIIKQENFIKQVQMEVTRFDQEILDLNNLIKKSIATQLKLDNLHHAITKNPVTLFNDKISHDLLLFSHRDAEFKSLLNEFLNQFLDKKEFQQIFDKIGGLLEEVYQKSKGSSIAELIYVYSNLINSIIKEGITCLDKPISVVLLDPEVEKGLRQYRNDISINEIIQLAKLGPEVQKKVLSLPICVDFYIQLLRTETKIAIKHNKKLELPEISWDSLIYLTKKWPTFFRRFGQSLNTFSEPDYIRLFKSTIKLTNEIVSNPISEKIFTKILFFREKSKDTFQQNFKTVDYIRLLHGTVLMAISNKFRRPHHSEVLKVYQELNEPFRTNFIKLFDGVAVNSVFKQSFASAEEQENFYLAIDPSFQSTQSICQHFKVESLGNLPNLILNFLQTIHVDASDHLAQIDNITDKLNIFEKNISLSVISSDKQLPLVNAIYLSVYKCCEYISNPKELENLIITKELEKMYFRRINNQK
jgi:hypothetical protein